MVGQVTEFPNARNSGDHNGHKRAKAPKIKVASAPGRPRKINMEPIEAVRLLSTFGTADLGFASLMLSGLINAFSSIIADPLTIWTRWSGNGPEEGVRPRLEDSTRIGRILAFNGRLGGRDGTVPPLRTTYQHASPK